MYKLIKRDGNAKRGEFHTVHGVIQTPVFMNVGTAAAIKGAVSTEDLQQIGTQVELSNTYHLHLRPGDGVVRDMGGAVEQVLARAGASVADCRSMGVGSPGTCNSADGVVERAYNLGWDHVPVCRMLEQRFGIPCRLSNDANCAALAEQVAGAAVGHDNVVLVTLGTGVGGGIIIGGVAEEKKSDESDAGNGKSDTGGE